MPLPTRSIPGPRSEPGVRSKIPGARTHQLPTSNDAPSSDTQVAKSHTGPLSSIPQKAKVGSIEQEISSALQRKPSARETHLPRQPTTTTRQIAKTTDSPAQGLVGGNIPRGGQGLRQPALKPPFTAYQQHFSPKKPIRSESVAGGDPSSNEGTATNQDNSEVKHLRDELLQLHLIHAGSQVILQQFKTSSQTKLRARHDALVRQSESIAALEQHSNKCISHTALQQWQQQHGNGETHQKLQLLANCVRDLDSLTANHGRFSKVVRHFQTWFESMVLALDSRSLSAVTSEELLFIEPIDNTWSNEVATLQRSLQDSTCALAELGVAGGGGIGFLVTSYKHLAANLLQELETCVSIHNVIKEQEEKWVEQMLQKSLEAGHSSPRKLSPTGGRGVWDETVTS